MTAHVPEMAELINDFDTGGWLQQVRRLVQDGNAPAGARLTMKRFQDALFALTETQVSSVTVQNALELLGEIVGWLATSPDARVAIRPQPLLRRAWVGRADGGTAKYRAAAALASLGWAPDPRARTPERPDPSSSGSEATGAGGAPNECRGDRRHPAAVDADGGIPRPSRSGVGLPPVPGVGTRPGPRAGGLGVPVA